MDSNARKSAASLASTYFFRPKPDNIIKLPCSTVISRDLGGEYRAPLVAGDCIQAGVRGDAVQPRAQRCAFFQAVAIPPGAEHGLLHRVFGVRQGTEHAVAMEQQLASMTLCGVGEFSHNVASDRATPMD